MDFNNPKWYYVFVALRLLAVFVTFGYLHPDGFFQSPEVLARDIFGFDTDIPWEFLSDRTESPCRTIVTPAIASGIPFALLKVLSSVSSKFLNPYFLLWFPKLFLFFASFIVDYTAWVLSEGKRTSLLVAASSWTAMTFMISPYSNTVETILLCFLLLCTFKEKDALNPTLIGIIIGVGAFNRFSFLFFAIPVVAYLLYNVFNDKAATGRILSGLTFGLVTTCVLITVIDSIYFGSFKITIDGRIFQFSQLLEPSFYPTLFSSLASLKTEGSLVITPLNNLRYNLNPNNLAEHGIHPRWYHTVLNMPFLFGPLYIAAIIPLSNMLDEAVAARTGIPLEKMKKKPKKPGQSNRPYKTKHQRDVYWVLVGCLLCHVGCLSIATHQEARFLLPNLICLVVIAGSDLLDENAPGWVKASWFAHCIIFFFLMGFAHQAGVVRAVADPTLRTPTGTTTHLIFYKTYPAPKHLLAQTHSTGVVLYPYQRFNSDGDIKKEVTRIRESPDWKSSSDRILLITPATIPVDEDLWQLKKSYWPHYDFDHQPETWSSYLSQLSLNVYQKL